LPLGSVQELLEFNESTTDDRAGVRLMDYRGSRLAYVDLHGLFESGDEDPDDSQVVVVDWDGDRVGLVVSEVIGQQQTVIKSLGAVPHQVDGVSGATILGDGSVALILDVPKLIAETASDRRETAGEAV
jgi:two-component system chemotaxis sensor kinase CheA